MFTRAKLLLCCSLPGTPRRHGGSGFRKAGQALSEQQLLELGEPAIRYLTEIMHRRPRQWFQDVDRLHPILHRRGPGRLAPGNGRRSEESVFQHCCSVCHILQ